MTVYYCIHATTGATGLFDTLPPAGWYVLLELVKEGVRE